MNKKKVIVGISGGVDSAVTAYILQKQGFLVEGLFMKNWDKDDYSPHCQSKQDYQDAMEVCLQLGIKLHYANFSKHYWDSVFTPFIDAYKKGLTPNPDIWCNQFVKFDMFYNHAMSLGSDFIATGHYAKNTIPYGEMRLSADKNKDQTYFLWAIKKEVLKKSLFPLGDMIKSEVRKIGKEADLCVADKKDSTGICFIGERNMQDFLAKYIPLKKGNAIDTSGKIIGEHKGAFLYTIGQRSKMGIGGVKGAKQLPWFVVDKNIEDNTVTLAQGKDNSLLMYEQAECDSINWLVEDINKYDIENLQARARHRGELFDCSVEIVGKNKINVEFNEKQFAIVAGQSLVFYAGEVCLGGGIVTKASREIE
jgi:tRNA-specific 2-thiouridylase